MKNNKLTYTKKNLKEFDRLTFAIFLCIQDMAKSGCNYVSKEMILCQINDSKNKNIKHEIDNLCSLGFINKVMTNCYHINRELFDLKDDFAIITTEEFYKWKTGEIELPYKSVLITFDDGFLSNYEYAFKL